MKTRIGKNNKLLVYTLVSNWSSVIERTLWLVKENT